MKHINKYESFDNYIITTNTDLRYAMLVKHKGYTYINCTNIHDINTFVRIDEIENISTVIKYQPNEIESKKKEYNEKISCDGIDFMNIEELKLLIDTKKYNL